MVRIHMNKNLVWRRVGKSGEDSSRVKSLKSRNGNWSIRARSEGGLKMREIGLQKKSCQKLNRRILIKWRLKVRLVIRIWKSIKRVPGKYFIKASLTSLAKRHHKLTSQILKSRRWKKFHRSQSLSYLLVTVKGGRSLKSCINWCKSS